jgi:hypothetical protein
MLSQQFLVRSDRVSISLCSRATASHGARATSEGADAQRMRELIVIVCLLRFLAEELNEDAIWILDVCPSTRARLHLKGQRVTGSVRFGQSLVQVVYLEGQVIHGFSRNVFRRTAGR